MFARPLVAVAFLAGLVGCDSPEVSRTRGGGAGADGTRSRPRTGVPTSRSLSGIPPMRASYTDRSSARRS